MATSQNKATEAERLATVELELADLRIGIGRMIERFQKGQASAEAAELGAVCGIVVAELKALVRGAAPSEYCGGAVIGSREAVLCLLEESTDEVLKSISAIRLAAKKAGIDLSGNSDLLHETTPEPMKRGPGVSRLKR